ILSGGTLAASCGAGSVEAVEAALAAMLQLSRVTLPNSPRPLTLPITVTWPPTEGGLLSAEPTSSQITLLVSELLKMTFEFLLSTTTSRNEMTTPLSEAFESLSKVAIKESAEYVDSCALAGNLKLIMQNNSAPDILPVFEAIPPACVTYRHNTPKTVPRHSH